MQVTYILSEEINSDLGIVNSARVSLGKKSSLIHSTPDLGCNICINQLCKIPTHWTLSNQDTKLITYLSKNNHWTPFAHSRLYFKINWESSISEELYFLRNYNPSGFSFINLDHNTYIKGSLYSWIKNKEYFIYTKKEEIEASIVQNYPIASKAFRIDSEPFRYSTHVLPLPEDLIASRAILEPFWYRILSCTLLVKVPIFIARQIRTSQVGLSYSDLYVESESFVFNEISRRYVSEEPEFYWIKEWRIRQGNKIKQGSTGISDEEVNSSYLYVQDTRLEAAIDLYKDMIKEYIAPEQARALLPQSMYTEFYMTGTLHRFAQFLNLRLAKEVQEETRLVAELIRDTLVTQFPNWKEFYNL